MCSFLSAIVLKNGDFVCRPEATDSHESLIESVGLRDDGRGAFVRVEFVPDFDADIFDLDTWTFRVDQCDTPRWFDATSAETRCRDRVRRLFVLEDRRVLLGGCWILGNSAQIRLVENARIDTMHNPTRYGWENHADPVSERVAIDALRLQEAGHYVSGRGRFRVRQQRNEAGWTVTDPVDGGASLWFPLLGEAALVVFRIESEDHDG